MDDANFILVQALGVVGFILFCLAVALFVKKVCRTLDEPDKANGISDSPTV